MIIDILCVLGYAFALFKGLKNGFILAVLTLVGYVLAYFLSNHFSSPLAKWFTGFFGSNSAWVIIVSYAVIFIAVLMSVRLLAAILEKAVGILSLGFLNRIAGVLLYAASFTIFLCLIFSLMSYLNASKTMWAKESFFYNKFLSLQPYFQELMPPFKSEL